MDVPQFVRGFNNLPAALRAVIALAALAAVVAPFVFSLTKESRTALFAVPLHNEQLAEVQERLAEWNVPFIASADNIAVDAKRRNEVLLRLSLSGVPHAHLDGSNEMLAKVSALTPQSVIDQQARSGLAADLELALRGIDGVQDASVIIAPAKAAVFADEQGHDASASVRLRLRPDTHLAADAVTGIRAFVAAGVAGLDEKHVTILDDRGVALGDGGQAADAADLQASLQSALDAAFGAGVSIVRVHVDYDTRAMRIKDVHRTPALSQPVASDRTDEHYTGGGKQYSKSMRSDDRGSDTRESQTEVSGSRVARISIGIAVDQAHGLDLYKIRALAEAAAGLDARRGDSVSVQAVAFHTALRPRKDGWFAAYGALLSVLPLLITGTFVLLGLNVTFKPVMRALTAFAARVSVVQTRKAVSGFAPAQVRGALRNEPPHTAAAIISALPAATAAAVLDMYPPEERSAIIRRMSRPASPLVPDFESVLGNA